MRRGASSTPLRSGPTLAARAEALLARHWWRADRTALALALLPLAWLYRALAALHRSLSAAPWRAAVPVVVVGNLVVGGAGKTPVAIALVQGLRAAGHTPGVVSRGHGRLGNALQLVAPHDSAHDVGDEPLLIARRTRAPVCVGHDRSAAVRLLCAQHPQVDVIVSDDGLQHHALARDAEVIVFDERGIGNGWLLPAGPLRTPLPRRVPARARVLYSAGTASTPLPGALALRSVREAVPLAAWWAGDAASALPLAALGARALLAVAGIAAPQKFFSMLEGAGLAITRLPLPDHDPYATLPWPAATPDVITTEKDAVKLAPQRCGATRVWVVPLDLQLPADFVGALAALLFDTPPTPAA